MYRLVFYVPTKYCEVVKNALFKKGAGSYKNYKNCSWETLGTGQFMPIENSSPFIGDENKLEILQETKVEMIVKNNVIKDVVEALRENHPYEEPAYSVIKLEDF